MPRRFRPIPTFTDAQERAFMSRVDARGENECWPWTGRLMVGQTRGAFSGPDGAVYPAPRIMWFLANKTDPESCSVLHNCPGGDDPNCCNPKHLWIGTRGDNARDRTAKGRTPSGDKHYLHLNPELRRGELNPAAKITEHQALEIRAAFYLLRIKLADKYGLTPRSIRDIEDRKRWKQMTQAAESSADTELV